MLIVASGRSNVDFSGDGAAARKSGSIRSDLSDAVMNGRYGPCDACRGYILRPDRIKPVAAIADKDCELPRNLLRNRISKAGAELDGGERFHGRSIQIQTVEHRRAIFRPSVL